MSQAVNLYVVYKMIKAISTPFDETEAFRLGIIDEKGKLLKKPQTQEEKAAYDPFHRMMFNIKRILAKVGLDKRYATYAGALLLMRESANNFKPLTEEEMIDALREDYNYLLENTDKTYNEFQEEMAVSVTGAAVAGTGDDPVHWGKPRGRPKTLGKAMDGYAFLRRKKKKQEIKSSYPRNAGKVEST